MAKDPKAAEGGEAPAPAPSTKKKLLIIIGGVVLLLAIIGGAAAFLLMSKSADHEDEDEEVVEVEKPAKKAAKKKDEHPPVYVALDPFTVNLVPETGDQYLQVALSLECEDPTAEGLLKSRMPKIRNGVTLLLSSKKASELTSREGKEKLALEIKATINAFFEPDEPAPTTKKGKKQAVEEAALPVKEVLFTSFIIQ